MTVTGLIFVFGLVAWTALALEGMGERVSAIRAYHHIV
jgi:hypothetical protein